MSSSKKRSSKKMPNSNSKSKIDFSGLTEFQTRVLKVVQNIPRGKVMSYSQVARAVGNPKSARAVGNALNKNPFAPKIACHRVIKSGGEAGGFARGTNEKIKLLKREGIKIKGGIIMDQYLTK